MNENNEDKVDKIGLSMRGHVLIRDKNTGEVLRDVWNAINLETMSEAIALAVADRSSGHIQSMVFGNGGSVVSAVGTVQYLPPNVTGSNAALYNQTYSKVVDDQSPLNVNPTDNYIQINHTAGTFYSDVQVTCTLEYNEPSGQAAYDDITVVNGTTQNLGNTGVDVNGTYIFDELGLTNFNSTTGTGSLLTHVIFHPVAKSLNRTIEVVYTLRFILS